MITSALPRTDGAGPPNRAAAAALRSRSSVAHDLAYLIPATVLSVLGGLALLALFLVGVATAVLGVGIAVVAIALLLASSFAAEYRRLLAAWEGHEVPDPDYRSARIRSRRWLHTLRDGRLWLELLYSTVVALPLRLVTFTLSAVWLTGGITGLTYALWGWVLPTDAGAYTLLTGAAPPVSPFVANAVLNVIVGAALLLTAPFVIRLLVRADAAIARGFLLPR